MLLRKALLLALAVLAPMAPGTAWCAETSPHPGGSLPALAAGHACQDAAHDEHGSFPDACDHCSNCCSCSSVPLVPVTIAPRHPAESVSAAAWPHPFVPTAPLSVIDRPPAA